jgi:hypothetical protein
MNSQYLFDTLVEHGLTDRFQSKLTLLSRVCDFVNFGKISFSDHVANVVVAFQILQNSKIFQKLKPLFDNCRFLGYRVIHVCGSKYQTFILVPDNHALLQIEARVAAASELAPKDHRLRGPLQRNLIYLAILDIDNLTVLIEGILGIKFVQFSLEKNHVVFLCRLHTVFFEEAHG